MYTAWMACLTPDKALYNFGRQNEHRHNLYTGKRICRAGVRHALLFTGGRPRPRRHSLRDMTFVALALAVLLAGCIAPSNPGPIQVALAEPQPIGVEVAPAPTPKAKPKPPAPAASASAAGAAGKKPAVLPSLNFSAPPTSAAPAE